jgi:hypothetical protein
MGRDDNDLPDRGMTGQLFHQVHGRRPPGILHPGHRLCVCSSLAYQYNGCDHRLKKKGNPALEQDHP